MCDEDNNSLEAILSHLSSKTNQIVCDRELVSYVKEDLDILLATDINLCVVFPRLKPVFLRVLRHQAAIFDLVVFCIGTGPSQSLVVCRKSFLRDEIQSVSPESPINMETKLNTPKPAQTTTQKKVCRRTKPTQLYYVPPAQRGNGKKQEEPKQKPKMKVDELYVFDMEQPSTSAIIPSPIRYEKDIDSLESPVIDVDDDLQCKLAELNIEQSCSNCEVVPPPHDIENDVQNLDDDETSGDRPIVETLADSSSSTKVVRDDECVPKSKDEALVETVDDIEESIITEADTCERDDDTNDSHLIISTTNKVEKDNEIDKESEEIRRAIVNINRKSRSLIKYIKNDDTLQINELDSSTVNRTGKSAINESDVSNWEDLFDDEGDIQQTYFDEITRRVGKNVKVMKASHDYSDYENTVVEDLEHVIELFDFPSTFRTQDLMQLYCNVHQDPMYVRWCDDTHALLVLSSPAQAQRALNIEHQVIKSRPLSQASGPAQLAACSTDLKPAMRRPQTNMQTARRLINTHLGTRSAINKEVAEKERRALKDAREQRRQERQNEKDAWDGRPRKASG